MMPIGTSLGFLFARPGVGSPNGFSIMGDSLVRRAKVTFETGKQIWFHKVCQIDLFNCNICLPISDHVMFLSRIVSLKFNAIQILVMT